MAKTILSVLSHTEYGNLEDSDIGLFASAFAPVAGAGIDIAGGTVQPGFLIETDLQAIQQASIPVYAFREDVERRGLSPQELIPGVELVSRNDFGKLVDQFDTVWNW